MKALLEHKEGTYIVAIWFVSYRAGDWMAMVWRDSGEHFFKGMWRSRHRKDNKIFDSDDEKEANYFRSEEDMTERRAEASMDLMAKLVQISFRGKPVQKISLHTDDAQRILEECKKHDFVRIKEVSP